MYWDFSQDLRGLEYLLLAQPKRKRWLLRQIRSPEYEYWLIGLPHGLSTTSCELPREVGEHLASLWRSNSHHTFVGCWSSVGVLTAIYGTPGHDDLLKKYDEIARMSPEEIRGFVSRAHDAAVELHISLLLLKVARPDLWRSIGETLRDIDWLESLT